ncbi:MAG: hypothetical protein LM601_03735 [Candidatus Verstraetearchaeota archaeon]|nr:hypothetical protein [Candidatus Verstraetearchaeota archaeon]
MATSRVWEKLEALDARIIYLILWIVILLPFIYPIGLPVSIGPQALAYAKAIDELPAGSIVVVSFDFSFGGLGELYPIAVATLHHLFTRPVKVVIIAIWVDGPPIADMVLKELKPEQPPYNKKYGVDWIFLGYTPGGETAMAALGKDFWSTLPTDYYYKKSVSEYPIMQGLRSAKDVALLVSFETGTPGADEWVRQWYVPYKVPMIVGCIGVMAPTIAPYLAGGQIKGALPGLRAAAEYELIIGRKGLGVASADVLSTSHIVFVLFVIIGNIAYFMRRRSK